MMGPSRMSGRSVPMPCPTVNMICHEYWRTTASARYGSISSGVLPEIEET